MLAVGQVRSVSKGGFASTLPLVNIYEIEGARLRRISVYNDPGEGLRAAGLSGSRFGRKRRFSHQRGLGHTSESRHE